MAARPVQFTHVGVVGATEQEARERPPAARQPARGRGHASWWRSGGRGGRDVPCRVVRLRGHARAPWTTPGSATCPPTLTWLGSVRAASLASPAMWMQRRRCSVRVAARVRDELLGDVDGSSLRGSITAL